MYFNNVDEVSLFDNFLKEYKERLNEILEENETNDSKITIYGFPSKITHVNYIFAQHDRFLSNGYNIFYHEENCNIKNLSILERFAFIAHEIGHIYDTNIYTYGDTKDDLRKEINVDLMACKIGLKDSLISGLGKLIDDQNPKEMEQIKQRIDFLLTSKDHQSTENED